MDQQLAGWDNKVCEMLRGVASLHLQLAEEEHDEDVLCVEDLIETLFGLGTALSKSNELERKSLVDRRFKIIDAPDAQEDNAMFSLEDVKQLEKLDKLRKAFNPGKGKGKGKGSSKGSSYRYQPYGYNNNGFGRRKGKEKCNQNNNNSYLKPEKFSSLQVKLIDGK